MPFPKKPTPELDLPAGDALRDAQKAAHDTAIEAQETSGEETHRVNPAAVEIDREIAIEIVEHNALGVETLPDGLVACWVRAYTKDGRWDTSEINRKQMLRVKVGGVPTVSWQVVTTHDHPWSEGVGEKTPEGYRRIGDTILMICRKDIDDAYRRLQAQHRGELNGYEVAAGYDDASMQQRLEDARLGGSRLTTLDSYAKAPQMARKQFDQMLRNGTMPGMPARAVSR